jgi:orotate phosphoribosyltransferase
MDDLVRRIAEVAELTGEFRLRSGLTASTYFDKYLFESDPSILRDIVVRMAPLVPADAEVLAGLELGGVPVVTALSLETGIPAAFVRKQAKDYGTCIAEIGVELRAAFTRSDLGA